MKALRSLSHALAWALIATGFGAITAWLLLSAACLYDSAWPLCRHPSGGWIVMILTVAGIFAPLALVAARRARRGLARGMYARVAAGQRGMGAGMQGGWLLQSLVRFAIEGEWHGVGESDRSWHPLLDIPEGYGWRIRLEDGAQIIVYFADFRQWLYNAWELQQHGSNSRQGATSQRTWDQEIGRDQVLARNHLLEIAGGLRRNRTTPNATRRICGTPWTILERLYEAWPPSEVK